MMQSNDPFFLPIIAYIGPKWTIHIFVMIWNEIPLEKKKI
jgi:hypothetical protein